MAEVRWTAEAERWMEEIHDFIAADSPRAAIRTIEGILRKTKLLQRFPELGQRYEGRTDRDVRILVYGHYRIAYVVKRDGQIDILGVFHGALDIEQYLGPVS